MTVRFDHDTLPQRIRFCSGGATEALAAETTELGAQRVMVIVAEPQRAIAQRIAADLPVALWHHEIAMHVPVAVAERARAAAAAHDIDVIVCVGGGSTTGLAKAVALTSGLPIIAVPTTYAGSEATDVWGLTEEARKTTGSDPRVLPRTIVYDASLMVTLPVEMSVASGLNAMAHCIDAMWAPRAEPINRALATEAIRALGIGLPAIVADPSGIEGREHTLYGAYLAAVAFASAGSGLHHKICHTLGGMFDLPHAQVHAVVLPHVLALNGPAAPEIEQRIAEAFGASNALDGLINLYDSLEPPRALGDLGMPKDGIGQAAAQVLGAVPAGNPAYVDYDILTALLRRAWEGAEPKETPAQTAPSTEQALREEELVERVTRSFDDCPDPRLKEVMQAAVRHLHGFVREVRLTGDEWEQGIEYLTETGHMTNDKRQEFILLSDTLGASMQTININNEAYRDATEATVFGPFFVENAPMIELGGDIADGAAGEPCWVEGTVTDTNGDPVEGARIEVWEADDDGFYDVQYDDGRSTGRAHLFSDARGAYRFWAITPTPYPIPNDGPVGRMLEAVGRSPMRASHLHFMVSAPGKRTLVTHIFVRGDELLDSDAVFGVKDSLVKDFARQPAGTPTPDGRQVEGAWSRTRFDIVLAPART